ncbi:MAG: hypothetical protein LBL67_04265 [Coriobacteriales bacterium]|jgi:hypothetical protein|nr:hypothetical protein [Coriobacteriales bacterium]
MARPHLKDNGRSRRVHFAVTPKEYSKIKVQAKSLNLTISAYIRQRALSDVTVFYAGDDEGLAKIRSQLLRAFARNNQAVKAINYISNGLRENYFPDSIREDLKNFANENAPYFSDTANQISDCLAGISDFYHSFNKLLKEGRI